MNTSILQKCLDELGKETPKLDYVRGMLETLIALQEVEAIPNLMTHPTLHQTALEVTNEVGGAVRVNGELNDEGALLDAKAQAQLAKVKDIAAQSTS